MKKIILFTQNHFYRVNKNNEMNMYSSAMSKWLKIFTNLSKELNAEMYSFRPKSYKNQKPHSSNIKIVNEDEIKTMKFDFAYINKDEGLAVYNSIKPNVSKVYMFTENDRIQNSLKLVDVLGHCSVNTYLHKKKELVLNILTPNLCNGNKIQFKDIKRENKVVFIGRYSDKIIPKINFLAKEFPKVQFDIYATKFWDLKGKSWVGYGPHQKNRVSAMNIFKANSPFNNIVLKDPIQHNSLYESILNGKYKIGFTPSISRMKSHKILMQINSSSKFYDYIGSATPILVEDIVPESYFVKKHQYLGEIYKNNDYESLKKTFKLMINKDYSYRKILDYAQKNHYPENRAEVIAGSLK